MKPSTMISGVFAAGLAVLALVVFLSMIPTIFWYTFDDALARALELPGVGNIPFWNVYGFTFFATAICSAGRGSSS